MPLESRACPCGSASYDGCCGRLHRGEAQASTPEELMRSRFAAYAVAETDYVWRTWHPRTRPSSVTHDPTTSWTGLEVLQADADAVEFRAHFTGPDGTGTLHERSVFAQRAGRWYYLEAL